MFLFNFLLKKDEFECSCEMSDARICLRNLVKGSGWVMLNVSKRYVLGCEEKSV